MESPYLPTPSSSPTTLVPPSQAREQIISLLLKLTSTPLVPPDYPDPPTDRHRGMIYAAACQRIQKRAGVPHRSLPKVFDLVKISTDLTGYLFPLHNYDLQVDICVKTVLFNLLLSDQNAVEEFERLRSDIEGGVAFVSVNNPSRVGNGIAKYFAEEAGFIPRSPSEMSSPPSPRRISCPKFGFISQARVQIALLEMVIHILVQTRSSKQSINASTDEDSEPVSMDDLLKILPNLIFPVGEFSEEKDGGVYLPMTENFVGFSKAISIIAAECNIHPSPKSQTHIIPAAIEQAIAHYTSIQNAFHSHPQRWKFAEAYIKGFISATLGSSEGFKQLFISDWRIALKDEWRRSQTHSFSYRRMSAIIDAHEVEKNQGGPFESEEVRRKSIVEEYDGWEFLR